VSDQPKAYRWRLVDAVEVSDLPPVARHLILTLCGRLSGRGMHTGQLGEYSPSLSELARLTGWKPTPVKKYLGELDRLGWLIRDQPPVERQRSEKAKTKYTVCIPGEPPDLSALSRPLHDLEAEPARSPRDLAADLAGSPDDLELGRQTTGARSPRGHRSDRQTDQTLSPVAAAIRAAVPGITDDEIETFIAKKIKPNCRTGNIAGYLASWSQSDIAAKVTAFRSERKGAKRKDAQAEIARFRNWAAKQPPCPDGMPGGDLIGPDGVAPCPLCRQATSPDSATTTGRMT
jgi:hypothetical protein